MYWWLSIAQIAPHGARLMSQIVPKIQNKFLSLGKWYRVTTKNILYFAFYGKKFAQNMNHRKTWSFDSLFKYCFSFLWDFKKKFSNYDKKMENGFKAKWITKCYYYYISLLLFSYFSQMIFCFYDNQWNDCRHRYNAMKMIVIFMFNLDIILKNSSKYLKEWLNLKNWIHI